MAVNARKSVPPTSGDTLDQKGGKGVSPTLTGDTRGHSGTHTKTAGQSGFECPPSNGTQLAFAPLVRGVPSQSLSIERDGRPGDGSKNTCYHCGTPVLTLLDSPVLAFTLRAEITTYPGALHAIVNGRRAVAGSKTKTGIVWGRLDADRIPTDGTQPQWASVFAAEHDCDDPLPQPPNPTPPPTVDTAPPF